MNAEEYAKMSDDKFKEHKVTKEKLSNCLAMLRWYSDLKRAVGNEFDAKMIDIIERDIDMIKQLST